LQKRRKMTQRGVRTSTIAAIILLSLIPGSGCAHRPGQTTLHVPPPPKPNTEASNSQLASGRADRKIRDVIKQLEKNGRRAEHHDDADRPVSQAGTTLESTVSTTGTIPPPAGWSSVVSTPIPGAANSRANAAAAGRPGARTGYEQSAHRHIASAIAFAIALALAIVLLPRWIGAR
jgi:hypothetical protein